MSHRKKKSAAATPAAVPPLPNFPFAPAVPPRTIASVGPRAGGATASLADGAQAGEPASDGARARSERPPRSPVWLRSARAERLREQLLVFGSEALADDELIELLLGAVIPPESRDEVVAQLFARFSTAAAILSAPNAALEGIPGVTRDVVAQFRAMRALAVRLAGARMAGRPLVRNRTQLIRVAGIAFGHMSTEAYCAIYTDKATRMITYDIARIGTVNRVQLYPREIIARALHVGAVGIIIIHNHPSGDPKPSEDDVLVTKNLKIGAAILGLEILDHLIVAGGAYTSLKDLGLL